MRHLKILGVALVAMFALGITATYLVFTNILNAVDAAVDIGKWVNLEKRYVLQLHPEKE